MDITVKLYAGLRLGRFEEQVVRVDSRSAVEAVLRDLGIPPEHVSVALVNDRRVDSGYRLSPGDTLSLFPLLGGG